MPRFTQRSIDFIAKASRQKKPEWLDKNRQEYEEVLLEPTRELVASVAKLLRNDDSGYRFPSRNFARIRRSGAKAKEQGWYKNWVGVQVARDSGSMFEDLPSLYFHLSSQDVYSAGGLYLPSSRQIKQIRAWIDQDASDLENLLKEPAFRKKFKALGDERRLKTRPRDYGEDHPRIEWLRMTGWYVWRPIPKKELFLSTFAERLAEDWRQILKLNAVLDKYLASWPKGRHAGGNLLELPDVDLPAADWD